MIRGCGPRCWDTWDVDLTAWRVPTQHTFYPVSQNAPSVLHTMVYHFCSSPQLWSFFFQLYDHFLIVLASSIVTSLLGLPAASDFGASTLSPSLMHLCYKGFVYGPCTCTMIPYYSQANDLFLTIPITAEQPYLCVISTRDTWHEVDCDKLHIHTVAEVS